MLYTPGAPTKLTRATMHRAPRERHGAADRPDRRRPAQRSSARSRNSCWRSGSEPRFTKDQIPSASHVFTRPRRCGSSPPCAGALPVRADPGLGLRPGRRRRAGRVPALARGVGPSLRQAPARQLAGAIHAALAHASIFFISASYCACSILQAMKRRSSALTMRSTRRSISSSDIRFIFPSI